MKKRSSFAFCSILLGLLFLGVLNMTGCAAPAETVSSEKRREEKNTALEQLAVWQRATSVKNVGAIHIQARHAQGVSGAVEEMDVLLHGDQFRLSIEGERPLKILSADTGIYFYYPDLNEIIKVNRGDFEQQGYDLLSTNLLGMGMLPEGAEISYLGEARVAEIPCYVFQYESSLPDQDERVVTRLSLAQGSPRLLRREVSSMQDGILTGTRVILYKDFQAAQEEFQLPRRVLVYDGEGNLYSTIVLDRVEFMNSDPPENAFKIENAARELSPRELKAFENEAYQNGVRALIASQGVMDREEERRLLKQAEENFRRARRETKGNFPYADYQLGRALLYLDKKPEALRVLSGLKDDRFLRTYGLSQFYYQIYLERGSFAALEKAAAYARQAVLRNPASLLADHYIKMLAESVWYKIDRGFVREAMESLNEAESILGPTDSVMALKVKVFLAMERWPEAVAAAEVRYQNHPDELDALLDLGDAYEGAGRIDEALKLYREGLNRFGREPVLRLRTGYLLLAGGSLQEGQAVLDDLVASLNRADVPERLTADYLNEVACYYVRYGVDLSRAWEYADRAVFYFPDDPAYMDTLGWILYHQGELERSLAALRHAQYLNPSSKEIETHLEQVLGEIERLASEEKNEIMSEGEDGER